MAKNSGGPYKKTTLLEDTIKGKVKEKEKKQEKKESTSKYDGLSTASDVAKFTPKKTTEKKQNTTPAVFKPRTLLETTITESKDRTKQNTNNRFNSRFTPSTVKNNTDTKKSTATRADGLSAIGRLNSLTSDEVERSRKAVEAREQERANRWREHSEKESESIANAKVSGWKPEFDRSGAMSSDSDDEVKTLAKDPTKLDYKNNLQNAQYAVKGEEASKTDAKHQMGYIFKRTDDETEVPFINVMTEDEYAAFMYVRGKYGLESAEKYLQQSGIQDRKIKAQNDAKYREQMIQQGKENPVASLIGTVVSAVPNAVAGVSYTLKKMANEKAGYEKHDTSSEEDWFNNNVQNLWQEGRLSSTDSKVLQEIYSGADMIARNLIEMQAGGVAGKVAKGLGAGKKGIVIAREAGERIVSLGTGSADKYAEQAQYGTLGKKGSVTTGVIAGVMDALSWGAMRKGTDKIAGKMFSKMSQGALKTVLSNTVGSVLSGAGIGFARQTIDNLSDHFIMENNSKYDILVKNFQQNGMGRDEAEKNAFIEAYVRPMGSAIMAGGLLSGTMAAYGTVRNAVSFTMRGAKVKNELYVAVPKGMEVSTKDMDRLVENAVIRNGLKQNKNSDAYKNAEMLRKKVNKGRILDNSEIGAQDILNQIEVFKTYEYAEALSELAGARIELGADLPPEADGSYSKGKIKVSADNEADARTIIDHEVGHLLEDGASDIYKAYETRLKDNVTFSKVTDHIKSQYDRLGKKISDEVLESEAAAEIGRLLMPKTVDDVNRLIRRVEGNPTLYDRMHNGIRALRTFMYAKGKKTFVDPETGFKMNYGEMLELEKTLEDALIKVRGAELKSKTDGSERFSVKTVGDKNIVWLGESGLTNKQLNDQQAVADYIAGHIGEVYEIIESGQKVYIGADLPKEYTHSKYTTFLRNQSRKEAKAKNKAIDGLGELIEIATNRRWEETRHKDSKDAKYGMYRYDSSFAFPVKDDDGKTLRVRAYDVELLIRNASDGKKYLYDIVGIKENTATGFNLSQRETRREAYKASTQQSVPDNSVPQNGDDVKYRLKSNPDVLMYGKDIESIFRDMELRDTDDDEINHLANATRQMLDYIKSGHITSEEDFGTQLDNIVGMEIAKHKHHSADEMVDISNTIVAEVRNISLEDIGKREAMAYANMQLEAEAGRADGEAYKNAKTELTELRKQRAIITGMFPDAPRDRAQYAMSSVGKKSYKIMDGAKNKAEFDDAVDDRLAEFVYRVTTNKESAEHGMKYVNTHNNDETYTYLENKTAWDEYDMATAAALLGEFNALCETERAVDVLLLIQKRATQAGKVAQATSLVYKLDASGKIAYWLKKHDDVVKKDIASRDNASALEKKMAEADAEDARERSAADKYLYDKDSEYRADSDNRDRLKKDLASRAEGRKQAQAEIAKLKERAEKEQSKKETIAYMAGAEFRVQLRQMNRIQQDKARSLMRYVGMSDEQIEVVLKEAADDPVKHRAFIDTLDEYKKQVDAELAKIESEKKAHTRKQAESEDAMKALRYEIREINKRQRAVQDDAIMKVIRVNDDGEIDTDGTHYVSDKPGVTEWETMKAAGEGSSKNAVKHYKSYLDEFYEKAGIAHIDSEKILLLKEIANAVYDIDNADAMYDVIMDLSKIRNTATGSWREALSSKTDEIRSKMYRGIEKLGRSQDGGSLKVKEHNPIKRNLKKAFGDDVEALRDIAINQMFGVLSDMDTRSLGAKAKTTMFMVQLMNVPTTFFNVISNAVEGGRMDLVNDIGFLIESGWNKINPKSKRTIGWENPFAGGKAGWERMRLSRLETALNVDILNNDRSRLGAPMRKRTFTKGPMASLERGLGYLLGATDEYFKGATEYQIQKGLKRYVDNGRITQEEADKYAQEQMLYRTFQNDSNFSRASQMIRDAGNALLGVGEEDARGVKEFGLGDFINAYPLVSGNVLDRVIDVTPVGALKVIYNSYKLAEATHKNKRDIAALEMSIGGKVSEQSQKAADEAVKTPAELKRKTILSLSSALTNGALIWAGMALVKNGIITGNPASDEEEDYERAKNNSQYGINISRLGRLLDGNDDGTPKNGDLVMPVGFLGNIYMGLAVGAELVQGNEEEMNFLDNYFSSNVMSAKEQFMSMSMISNINRTFNNFKYADSVGEGFAATGADVLMSFLPSVVRQFGNAMDDYGRDPYKGATYLDIITGKFKSKIPLTNLREDVPLRIDLFGEAEVHTLGNKGKDIANNMLLRGLVSKYETNVVTEELDRLTAQNKELLEQILPKTPYRNNTGEFENGTPYEFRLDDENYEKYANLLGMTTYKAMHTLLTSNDYKHLTETQKTTALAEISKESAELVKEIWVSHQKGASDTAMQKRIDKYVESNKAKASKVVKTDNALKYIKLDGVKVEDVIDTGYRVPYTEEEKVSLIGKKNYYKELVRSGTYKDDSLGGYSRYWTDEDRQYMIDKLDREMRDIASGADEKWVTIRGEFNSLTDEEKGIVINQIGYNIDKVRLPDNVGELVDTSVETEPVDLTYPFTPRTSSIINSGWRADDYDKEQADKKKAEAAEKDTEETESKSVDEYLSEYKGSGGGYSGYSRNYSKKSYNNSYGGSGSEYRFTPSIQPVQKNTYRFTPRFGGGNGGRFGKKF